MMAGEVGSESKVTGNGHCRKQWRSIEQKRDIVEETLLPGASVSIVARRHDVNANQVFKWRGQYRRGELEASSVNTLVPVGRMAKDGMLHLARMDKQRKRTSVKTVIPLTPEHALPTRIEIELPSGIKVLVDGDVRGTVLGRVVKLVRGLA